MIAKIFRNNSFNTCVHYVLNREEASLLDSVGIRNYNTEAMIDDLNAQRRLRPDVLRPVGHTVISWSSADRDKLTGQDMAGYAREYLEKMSVVNTQFLTVLHTDTDHPHVHVVHNRVDNDAKTIDLNKEWYKNRGICEEMTERYGFHRGTGKIKVNREALNGKDSKRFGIHDSLELILREATSWNQMESMLALQDIKILYKSDRASDEIVGVVFDKEGVKFKGSAIGQKFSYPAIVNQLKANEVLAVSPGEQSVTLDLTKLGKRLTQNDVYHYGKSMSYDEDQEEDLYMSQDGLRAAGQQEDDFDDLFEQRQSIPRGRRMGR